MSGLQNCGSRPESQDLGLRSNSHITYGLQLSCMVLVGVVGRALKAEITDSSRRQGLSFRERSRVGINLVLLEEA